jgi:hypothetical protein
MWCFGCGICLNKEDSFTCSMMYSLSMSDLQLLDVPEDIALSMQIILVSYTS